MKTILVSILMLLSLTPFPAVAQQQAVQDSMLDRMTGKWLLQGTIEGKETTHDIVTEWVLGHQYLEMKEVSREKDVDGKPVYEATVFISVNKALNRYDCLWLDNTGSSLNPQAVGHAQRDSDKLEFLFKYSETSIFHTTFVYNPQEDTWQWIMDDEENGKLQSFAKMKLTRIKQVVEYTAQ